MLDRIDSYLGPDQPEPTPERVEREYDPDAAEQDAADRAEDEANEHRLWVRTGKGEW